MGKVRDRDEQCASHHLAGGLWPVAVAGGRWLVAGGPAVSRCRLPRHLPILPHRKRLSLYFLSVMPAAGFRASLLKIPTSSTGAQTSSLRPPQPPALIFSFGKRLLTFTELTHGRV